MKPLLKSRTNLYLRDHYHVQRTLADQWEAFAFTAWLVVVGVTILAALADWGMS